MEFIPAAKPIIGEEEQAAVVSVMRTGMLAQGHEVSTFEKEFSDAMVHSRPTVAVNSGTSGLHLGLLAAGIGPGDEVIVPSFTFAATANSIALTGAKPVFADIEPEHYSLDAKAVEPLISSRTRALMPVHLYGHPANMQALSHVASSHNLMLFEDAAQAHGATFENQQVGTFGDFAMFSLYPTKNMTSGEGGMVSTNDSGLERRLRLLRNQGMERQYENELIGFNARMTDLHASIGRVQLQKLSQWTKQRQSNAQFLSENLRGVTIPQVGEKATHVYHQYTIRVPDRRDDMLRILREKYRVGAGVYYPVPSHRLPSFKQTQGLPVTETAAQEVLSLPVHPSLSEQDLDRIVTAVNSIAESGA